MADEKQAAAPKQAAKSEERKPVGGGTLPGPSGTPEERAGANVGREYARGVKQGASKRREAPENAVEGTPRAVTTPEYAEPGVDVSNADVNLAEVSAIAEHSEYHPNPDPNPAGLTPAPGPSSVQVLGHAGSIKESREPLGNKAEENRG